MAEKTKRNTYEEIDKQNFLSHKPLMKLEAQMLTEANFSMCYSTLETTGELIMIKRGEDGYYLSDVSMTNRANNRMYADWQNHQLRVSKVQEEAMVAGSMFGWDMHFAKLQEQE